jgi:hypothetical protein
MSAAIAQAAHDTLVALFPSQRDSFDSLLAEIFVIRVGQVNGRRTASSSVRARQPRSWRYVTTTVPIMPSHASGSTTSRATRPARGRRTR